MNKKIIKKTLEKQNIMKNVFRILKEYFTPVISVLFVSVEHKGDVLKNVHSAL